MDKFIVKILIISILGCAVQYVMASDRMNYNTSSAEVADMFRYGNVETSLFTGRLNLSIPLYSLDDPDFSLNIALTYNAEGFKPRKHSGYVGYGWFLQAGGCITREVRNYPDETCRYHYPSRKDMMGMLRFVRDNKLNKDSVFNFSSSVGKNCLGLMWNLGQTCNADVDYLPDIFHFNFCGYTGSFMIGNDGTPLIISGEYVKIDLSDLSEPDFSALPSNSRLRPLQYTTITLTAKDGYKYVFGGDISSVGYTVSLADGTHFDEQYPPVITSWYLKKVIAPNNREISFYYKEPIQSTGLDLLDPLLEMNEYYDFFAQRDYFIYSMEYQNNDRVKLNMVKTCILDSIVVSGVQSLCVEFFNSPDPHSLYSHPHYGQGDRPYMLDSIHVISTNRLLRRVNLNFNYQSSSCGGSTSYYYWRFLNNVYISGIGAYNLHYQSVGGSYYCLYVAGTDATYFDKEDYYGFGTGSPTGAMLTQIDYPTGGCQKFTYESHNYSKERRYVAAGRYNVNMETVTTNVQSLNGVRISSVKTYSGPDKLVETKNFTYFPSHSANSGSSGIHYNNRLVYLPSNNDGGLLVTGNNTYSMLDTHIGYSYVEETTKDASNNVIAKIGYTFDVGNNSYTSINNPDIHMLPSSELGIDSTAAHAAYSGMLAYNSKLTPLGHLLAKDYYRGNDMIRSELYCYNGVPLNTTHLIPSGRGNLGCTDTVIIFAHAARVIARRIYICPDVMQQHVIQDYYDNDSYPTFINKCYLYDKKLRVKKEYTGVRDNEWLYTKYSYPDEFLTKVNTGPIMPWRSSWYSGPVWQLTEQHRINDPFEIISGYEDASLNKYITAGKLNLYSTGMTIINMDSIISYAYLERTMELAINGSISEDSYTPLKYVNETPSFDERYKLKCKYTFNIDLRLTRISPYGKLPTKYTWNGIYPVTKQFGNLTYTYTYIPYVGLSSYTDERGITTYYSYDNNGKLIEVYQMHDGRKEILSAYMYHIKTE